MRSQTLFASLMLSALLAAAAVLAAPAGPAATEGTAHPDVGETTLTCDGCHAESTPEVHAAWYDGAHGLAGVKCFVCHGSRTERFAVEVSTDRCGGCHAAALESMEGVARFAGMEGADCFSCHPPHRLSPHAASLDASDEDGGGAAGDNGGTR